jgi:hypothetical protein
MSQRLTSTVHPLTGQPLIPFKINGIYVSCLVGKAPEGEGTEETESGSEGAEGTGSETGSEGQGSEDKKDDKVSRAELDAVVERMKAADRRAEEAQKKVKEFEDKDKDEATKNAERIAALEAETQQKDQEISNLRIQNAFLSSNEVQWHDPDVAVGLADLSGVLKEDGTVDKGALKSALKKLATDKPFLVKSEEKEKEQNPPPAGRQISPITKSKKELDKEALIRKYPSLAT